MAPYFAGAIVVAVAIWTIQQRRVQDSNPSRSSQPSAASQPTPVRPARSDIRTLFSADDYPAEAQARGEQGTVQAELAIDTTGRVSKCTIIRSGGATLDQATCRILEQRARFTHAHDVDGKAVPDRVVTPPITWRLEG